MSKVLLGDVIDRIDGNEDRLTTSRKFYVGGEHYDTDAFKITRKGVIKGTDLGYQFHYPFEPGDVLFMTKNPHLRKAGQVDFEGICSIASFVLRTKDENVLMQNYIPLLVHTDDFWNYLEANKSGSVNYFITWKTLSAYEFDLPDIGIQKKLTKIFWSINDTMEAYKELLKRTDELVKSQFIEMFGDLTDNPKRYILKPLSELLLVERGGSPRPISDYVTEADDGVNWIKIGDADEGSIYITHTKEKIKPEGTKKSRYVQPGDFLLSNSMSFGRPYILTIDGYIHDGWLVLRDEHKLFDKMFLHALLSSSYASSSFESMAAGSVVKNLNKELVGRLLVPVPPIEEQKRYATVLQQSDKSKFAVQEALKELTAAKKALMKKIF